MGNPFMNRRGKRIRKSVTGFLALWLLAAPPLGASGLAEKDRKAPSFKGYRSEDRRMAEKIIKNTTFKAENRITFRADEKVFQYLIDHPIFAAAVSRGLGHDRFHVQHVQAEKGRYRISHGYARGTFWKVEREAARVAYLAKGVYDRPAFRWIGILIRARSYVVETFRTPDAGGPEKTILIRAYLHVENPILGKILGWIAPLIRRAFESKLTASYRIAPDLSRMAYEGGEAFLERVRTIEGLDPARLRNFEDLLRKQSRRQAKGCQADFRNDA